MFAEFWVAIAEILMLKRNAYVDNDGDVAHKKSMRWPMWKNGTMWCVDVENSNSKWVEKADGSSKFHILPTKRQKHMLKQMLQRSLSLVTFSRPSSSHKHTHTFQYASYGICLSIMCMQIPQKGTQMFITVNTTEKAPFQSALQRKRAKLRKQMLSVDRKSIPPASHVICSLAEWRKWVRRGWQKVYYCYIIYKTYYLSWA